MAKQALCPLCGKATGAAFKPFCSKRCADIDLGKWFRGDYAVATVESDDEPDDADLLEDKPP